MSDPPDRGPATSECDTCGEVAPLHPAIVSGIETFCCARCMGVDPEDDDEEEEEPDFTCGVCGGSGGGPEHWACSTCGGRGEDYRAKKAYLDDRRGDEEYDRRRDEPFEREKGNYPDDC